MAKKSKIAKNEKRKEIVARYAERRQELKAIIRNPETSDEDRLEAQFELNRQPRDASPARVRNRDSHDGRPRGYLRKFGLSRVRMREMAHRGELPGVRKSSW
ncbi:30S ribosomal protein S14 [Corynebacterium sp. MSK044]|uniref:Small ribosomal subunit protein uS14 n=2 Tax=Corynebacterium TaxID=1716 RepID=A0A2N6T328_9CORY|nr:MULTISPECIES: 30S ribosomal protein S14 [Corynebacterium]MDK8795074.1 30S ribosomal protein S14 [Corynebacterium sp. MSK041]MDK8797149.1 30S ribosomal protein S14 [Corynebacterium sp. MSK044]PMC63713.1 30S ribosomal protein S14 [Corynebacterium tuscaniense]